MAAAASASTVGVSNGATTSQSASIQPEGITAARIQRSDQATRDAARLALADSMARKLQASAEIQAKARAAKLAANRTATQRRAAALAAAKKASAAAEAKKKAQAAKAEQARAAAEAAAPKASLPTSGYRITATFGQGGGRWARNHTGLDFAAPYGTPVKSVLAGEVIQAEFAGAYGRQVKVRHSDGTVTSYAHMSEFTVSVGDSVRAGEQVGSIGTTGNTTGPHVHFEVLLGGETQVNPRPWLIDHGVTP